jgi:hypothetical protein
MLMPIPGTQLWEESVRNGKINPNTVEWQRLSVFADYQHSKLTNFQDWMTYRKKVKSVYLAEDTLPEERLYELMHEHYQSMEKLQELRNVEIQKREYNQNKFHRIFELITETETSLFDQEAAIKRWKFMKEKGKVADDAALTVCSALFNTLFRLANEMAEYGMDSINFEDEKHDMAEYYREIEDVIKIAATSETLDDVNQVIEEKLMPKLKIWPAISRAIGQKMKQYIHTA